MQNNITMTIKAISISNKSWFIGISFIIKEENKSLPSAVRTKGLQEFNIV